MTESLVFQPIQVNQPGRTLFKEFDPEGMVFSIPPVPKADSISICTSEWCRFMQDRGRHPATRILQLGELHHLRLAIIFSNLDLDNIGPSRHDAISFLGMDVFLSSAGLNKRICVASKESMDRIVEWIQRKNPY